MALKPKSDASVYFERIGKFVTSKLLWYETWSGTILLEPTGGGYHVLWVQNHATCGTPWGSTQIDDTSIEKEEESVNVRFADCFTLALVIFELQIFSIHLTRQQKCSVSQTYLDYWNF